MSDYDHEPPKLPNTWHEVRPDQIYQPSEGRNISFGIKQVKLGILYDPIGKHLRAINKGLVPVKGNTGLVPSEEPDYDFKTKILGKGGDRRFHGKIVEGILHFPGKQTTH
ncbi:MAG: hypothetical protein ACFBSC_15545 [Microcoleaceae cyanobacterium]